MKTIKKIKEFTLLAESIRKRGKTIGIVPTMGFLHEGHLRLIRMARKQCEVVVLSIFVNPAQFGPGEDFEKYPRDINRDRHLAEKEGVDYVFYPAASEMYKSEHKTFVEVEGLGDIMCGAYRQGHFKGVATVVLKLLNITKANRAYFGEKDYQQMIIVKRMVDDLNVDVEIVRVPTVREEDGLAMSSRNRYLDRKERENAGILYKCLNKAKDMIKGGEKNLRVVRTEMIKELEKNRYISRVDYIEFRNPLNLQEISEAGESGRSILVAVAAWIGSTRLIDNMVIKL